jgi:hypothetical protein
VPSHPAPRIQTAILNHSCTGSDTFVAIDFVSTVL